MLRQVILPFLMLGVAGTADPAPSLDWIGGHWCAELGDETVEEVWLPPHGGVAVGLSRTRTHDRTVAFEYLRIVYLDGIPSYIAQPGGRPPAAFKRTAGGEDWIRFENPEHDFPQRIEYRREGETLHAEIAGPGENGKEMAISFDYRRCDPRPADRSMNDELKPIRSEADYEKSLAEVERRWGAKSGTPEGDRLDVLATLIDAYEARHYPMDPPDPIEAIKFRMEQQGLSRKAGGRQRAARR